MTGRRPSQPPDLAEADQPTSEPIQFLVERQADGTMTLGMRDAELEQRYAIADPYSRTLFSALCLHAGAKVYRRKRQHGTTVCVMAPLAVHDEVWARFLRLSAKLEDRLKLFTQEFVNSEVCSHDKRGK